MLFELDQEIKVYGHLNGGTNLIDAIPSRK